MAYIVLSSFVLSSQQLNEWSEVEREKVIGQQSLSELYDRGGWTLASEILVQNSNL